MQNTLPQGGEGGPWRRWVAEVEQRPWLLHRVIQMIDENKEQLRNLFRNYNVLDVQPAISVQLPDDMSALQVCSWGPYRQSELCPWTNLLMAGLLSPQMAIIVLAILLFLAAMLFVLMNWYYRTM